MIYDFKQAFSVTFVSSFSIRNTYYGGQSLSLENISQCNDNRAKLKRIVHKCCKCKSKAIIYNILSISPDVNLYLKWSLDDWFWNIKMDYIGNTNKKYFYN